MSETSAKPGEGGLLASASRAQRIAVVEGSPRAVAAHDKEAWVGLFSRDGVVEDPVGAPPCRRGSFTLRSPRGGDDLECFYDAFIAPNDVRFEIERDFVVGGNVMREVVLHIDMPSGLHANVPAHLLYQLREEEGALRVARMAAHWEQGPLKAQTLNGGLAGYRAAVGSGWRMLTQLGLRFVLDYQRGTTKGMGEMGHAALEVFADAVNAGKGEAVSALFAGPDAPIGFPVGRDIPVQRFLEEAGEKVGKKVEIELSKLRSSGWTCSCSFVLRSGGHERPGVALFGFDPESRKALWAQFFWDE